MSSEGLPVDGVVGTDIVLGTRSTQQATDEAKSILSADSAAQSADAAFKFSKKSEQYSNESSAFAEKSAASAAAAAVVLDNHHQARLMATLGHLASSSFMSILNG